MILWAVSSSVVDRSTLNEFIMIVLPIAAVRLNIGLERKLLGANLTAWITYGRI